MNPDTRLDALVEGSNRTDAVARASAGSGDHRMPAETNLIARLLATPILSWFLVAPIVVVGALQQFLGPEARAVEHWRQRLWVRAQGTFSRIGGYTVYRSKSAEYVCSVAVTVEDLERHLWRGGFHRNLLAAKKYRRLGVEKQWSASSWVYRDGLWADDQLHVTLFRRPDGVDCYAHREPSNLSRPLDHWLVRDQAMGDPDGTLRAVLDAAGLERMDDERLQSDCDAARK